MSGTGQVLIAVEKQKVAEKEAETLKKRAVTDAEKDAKVSEILMHQRVMEQESTKKQQEIENHIYLARERSLADASYYRFVAITLRWSEVQGYPEYESLDNLLTCPGSLTW